MPTPIKKMISCDIESTREYTREGFLKVKIRAGKIGVQRYSCDESGLEDVNGTGWVNVARLPEDVTKQESLDSLEFKDITLTHPDEKEVTPDNYGRTTAGVMTSKGTIDDDGRHITVDGLIKDKTAIRQVEGGKNQVSLGYDHYIEKRSGTLDGEPYDFVQTDILYNHLAIVHRGRAKTATILDHEAPSMTEEEIAAMQAENKRLNEANTKLANDAESAELDRTIDMAKTIDAEYDPKDKTAEQIKREQLGDRISANDSLDVVNYAYRLMCKEYSGGRSHKPLKIKTGSLDSDDKKIAQDAEDAYQEYLNEFNGED